MTVSGWPVSATQRGSKGKRKLEIYVFVCIRSPLALPRGRRGASVRARARAAEFGMQFGRPRWPLSTPRAPVRVRHPVPPSLPVSPSPHPRRPATPSRTPDGLLLC